MQWQCCITPFFFCVWIVTTSEGVPQRVQGRYTGQKLWGKMMGKLRQFPIIFISCDNFCPDCILKYSHVSLKTGLNQLWGGGTCRKGTVWWTGQGALRGELMKGSVPLIYVTGIWGQEMGATVVMLFGQPPNHEIAHGREGWERFVGGCRRLPTAVGERELALRLKLNTARLWTTATCIIGPHVRVGSLFCDIVQAVGQNLRGGVLFQRGGGLLFSFFY